ncbi:DUF3305 domain-containing protein [Candidatus Persebacteraceae bacterium Df01]|uniref:DUF3305 domain-containing protein n=1 Tax=Candidatus Doriopsillibacter californiensis TaxID=2970740 RepID=A0ABT7QMN3_9GAMM|nr:DUF3305 domain-containing protein [Candidatus Persebacteraceae bacterium Df01]
MLKKINVLLNDNFYCQPLNFSGASTKWFYDSEFDLDDKKMMPSLGETIPLSVTLAFCPATMNGWQYEKAELIGLARSPSLIVRHEVLQQSDDNQRIAVWHGIPLVLQKESAESYWANLSSPHPQLFVICREEEGSGTEPIRVTASGEEAAGHGEVDDRVFATPLPVWLGTILEQFVVKYYQPQPKKVRRRI